MKPSYCTLFIYVILHHLYSESIASEIPCNSLDSVLVKHSLYQENGSLLDTDTGTIYPTGTHWTSVSGGEVPAERFGCPCMLQKPCLRKCCPPKKVFEGNKCIEYNQTMRVNVTDNDGSNPKEVSVEELFGIVYRNSCDDNSVIHLFNDPSNEGKTYIRTNDGHLQRGNVIYKTESFCIDYFFLEGDYGAVICEKNKLILPTTMMDLMVTKFGYESIFTALFIFLNTVLYSIGTQLSSLHEKCVACYMCSYIGIFQTLAIIHFNYGKIPPQFCLLMASLYTFNNLSKYTWANVICVKITLKFRSIGLRHNKLVINPGISKTKKFLFYCLYAWGIPSVFVLALFITENTPALDDSFTKPIIGGKACFFHEMAPLIIFTAGPAYFFILVNMLLFAYTAFKIFWRWRGSSMLKNDQQNKERFNMFVKLMLVMGAPTVLHFLWWASLPVKLAFVLRYLLLIIEWSFFPSLLCNNKIRRNLINIFLPSCNKSVNVSSPENIAEQTSPV